MTQCYFCPRWADDTLHEVYYVCRYCRKAFEEGFNTGRVYQSQKIRLNPRKIRKGIQ